MRLQSAFEAAHIPGALAIVADADGIVWAEAHGVADPSSARAMTPDTLFQLASMTKAITSVAALQLVEQGKLQLDAPLAALLPALAALRVIAGFADDGSPRFRPAVRPITLRHLLTHTSGMGYFFAQEALARAGAGAAPPAAGSLASLKGPLLFDPGDDWAYGVSTDWVGLAVEAASGSKLGDYFDANIFAPLGMSDTGFWRDQDHPARLAALHARQPDGHLAPLPISIGGPRDSQFQSGGGGLTGTGPDYIRFLRMLLNRGSLEGTRILAPETVAGMTRNQIGGLRAGHVPTVLPAFALETNWFPEQSPGWGLGFMINPEPGPDGRAANSLAWAGIANTYFWIDPASDVAAVLLMQHLPFADPAALALLAAFERAVYAPACA